MRKNWLPALIAGGVAAMLNLLVEWWLNREVVAFDYMTSAVLGVLTALAIFVLFHKHTSDT